jgi:phosphatidylglycerophosphatase A
LSHPAALIATGCGIGLLPWMPGTWASLAALPVGWLDRNVKGGIGVMLDDIAAALYALILIAIAEGVVGVRP